MLKSLMLCVASLCLFTATLSAGEKTLMHCFAFTAVDSATDADWQAFYKATDQMPSKIPGIKRVWYGKLRRPLSVGGATRQYGACIEMDQGSDPAATLKAYAAHPYHKEWEGAYSKVRVAGTTTYDILGQ